jgi:transporter family-2 protein
MHTKDGRMKFVALFSLGIVAGGMITLQSALNANLGRRAGQFGSVLVLTFVSIAVLAALVALFPETANFRDLPRGRQIYLYLGGVLGVAILAAPIYLVPRIGATSTLTALVVGQLALALVVDHFGFLGVPQAEFTPLKLLGFGLLVLGTLLIR